jgi:hypothetical protein
MVSRHVWRCRTTIAWRGTASAPSRVIELERAAGADGDHDRDRLLHVAVAA